MIGRGFSKIVLLGYENIENLGIRYLSSSLKEHGHMVRIFKINSRPGVLIRELRAFSPDIIGFSLIFQEYLPDYISALNGLHANNIKAHYTIGGHFPSFEPEIVLEKMTHLHSVVMYEGEKTLVELSESIGQNKDWRKIKGIAFRQEDGIIRINNTRKAVQRLDDLPWPDRSGYNYNSSSLPMASILGSRGCAWKCSFCSIQSFYKANGTPGRRLRSTKSVLDELEFLSHEKGIKIVLWQDDDFFAGGKKALKWAHDIADGLIKRGLHERLKWRISCRSNEATLKNLNPLASAGLTHVYLGVESGSDRSLRHLNKSLKVEAHIKAKEVIQELGLSFDFGFMLLEPWSDIDSVKENIKFLEKFTSDGSVIFFFVRMMPYAGTSAYARLDSEGRLKHSVELLPDYNFLDPRLDVYYNWMLIVFHKRNHSPNGTGKILQRLLFEAGLSYNICDKRCKKALRNLVMHSNKSVLDILWKAIVFIETTDCLDINSMELHDLRKEYIEIERRTENEIAMFLCNTDGNFSFSQRKRYI